MATTWVCICPDGVARHSDDFATKRDAMLFAENGHFCMATIYHRVVRRDFLEEDGEAGDLSDYLAITDERNDGSPTDVALTDLDAAMLYRARRYALDHGKNWPPEPGDFDRMYEEAQAKARQLGG